ncbi:MAG TPA: hypothetical protein VGL94_18210 [Ktedonobacteraceae bacterium]
MLDFASIPVALPVVSLCIPPSSSLDLSCLDGRITSHPKFGSGYTWAYDDYFDREGADPGDMVCGVSVTVVDVVANITRSLLESDYGRKSDLFFWLVGACAGFLAALAHDHGKQAQAGLVVLTSLSGVILSEVIGC